MCVLTLCLCIRIDVRRAVEPVRPEIIRTTSYYIARRVEIELISCDLEKTSRRFSKRIDFLTIGITAYSKDRYYRSLDKSTTRSVSVIF